MFSNLNQRGNTKTWIYLTMLIFVISFGTGVFVGRMWTVKKQISNENGEVQISKVLGLYAKSQSDSVDFDQFWSLWKKVKEMYVEQPVDDVKLYYGAMEGMVAGLGDPYSVYFPPKKADEFAKELSGEFEGIGAEVGIKNDQIVVIAPLPKSPAEKAGILAGDKIYAINKEETANLTVDEAVAKIRGPKGTEVILTISHDGMEKVQDVKIIRDKINIPTVVWEMKDNNIVYLRLAYFNENTWSEFDKAVKEILIKNPKGIIFDLRRNPGGFLDTAVKIASEWVKDGVIVKEKFSTASGKPINNYDSDGQHRFLGLKTVVLVDEGSASASEIVAGALQDYNLAKLVGAKTYGKGSVQDFQVLPDGSAFKVTIANWYTPKDRQISKLGIIPDIIIDKAVEEIKDEKGNVTYKDLALEKALEILK